MSTDTAVYKPDLVDGDRQTIERVIAVLCREFGLATYSHTSLRAVVGSIQQIIASASMRQVPSAESTLVEVSEPGSKHPHFEVQPTVKARQQSLFEIDHALLEAPLAENILQECIKLATMLMKKNKAYGNSAVEPLRVFSKADPVEQIRVRMDDKLSRLVRGQAAGEDALMDLVGYYILLQIAEAAALENASGSNGRPAS